VTWTFKLGDVASPTSVTVQAFTVRQDAAVARFGNATATIVVDNDDGAWTPSSLGGSGTWASQDWLATGMWIDATINATTVPVFHGVVTNIQVDDNGYNSTVTLTAMSSWAVGGRSGRPQVYTDWSERSQQDTWEGVWTGEAGGMPLFWDTEFPHLGQSDDDKIFDFETVPDGSGDGDAMLIPTETVGLTAMDATNNYLMQSGPFVAYPTTIEANGTAVDHHVIVIGSHLTRDDRTVIDFAETPTGAELPIQKLESRFQTDQVVNETYVTPWYATDTSVDPDGPLDARTSSDATSLGKYGARTRSMSSTWTMTPSANFYPSLTTDWSQYLADFWTARYSDAYYTWDRLELSDIMLDTSNTSQMTAWRRLLDITTGLWAPIQITATPTNSDETVTESIITSRVITGQPGRVRVTLGLLPLGPNWSFVLNSSDFGVLDTDRLG